MMECIRDRPSSSHWNLEITTLYLTRALGMRGQHVQCVNCNEITGVDPHSGVPTSGTLHTSA